MKWMKLSLLPAVLLFTGCYVVDPGERGVKVTLGHMDENIISSGFGMLNPFTTSVWTINVQQQTQELEAPCFSSDLQQVNIKAKVLYRVPEASTILILRDYSGNPFDSLVAPRIQEALKEATALKTAADIVKTREQIKMAALEASKKKVGAILVIEDIVIEDVSLSQELENAIEAKMVQQQEAEKATFKKQQAETDALTKIIAAKAEAEAIAITGQALQQNPRLVELRMVEKWNGVSPTIVGAGVGLMLPVDKK